MFAGVALLILAVACFNFMNLSTAKALKRAKEVGMRKVMGAYRNQLMAQFFGESMLLVLTACLLSALLVLLVLPFFNVLMGSTLHIGQENTVGFIVVILGIATITAVLAGSYPAIYLSSFSPTRVLKGDRLADRSVSLRKALIIGQFGIAFFLIAGTAVIIAQIKHMKRFSLGFDRDHVISFPLTKEVKENWQPFRNALLQQSAISNVTNVNQVPGMIIGHWTYLVPEVDPTRHQAIITMIGDEHTLEVLGIALKEGRNLSREIPTDYQEAYLINETAVKEFMMEAPIGQTIQVMDNSHPPGKIVGVVEDFHFRSLHNPIQPLVIRMDERNAYTGVIKLAAGQTDEGLKLVEHEWKKYSLDYPLRFSFLDDALDNLYRQEERISQLTMVFAILAITVALMGIFGLSSYMAEQRRKEIGIRKVLGAGVKTIMLMLSKEYARMVLVALILAAPVSVYVTTNWLNSFPYKVELKPPLFISMGILVFLLALVTISSQALKAATANPAESLKEN
jgi:putative ABC transport system permease protein